MPHRNFLAFAALSIVVLCLALLPGIVPAPTPVLAAPQDTPQSVFLPLALRPAGATPTATARANPTATRTQVTPGDNIYVDRRSVALFSQIPEQYLNAAAALTMMFSDRSVGGNISEGLDCLSYATDESAPSHCDWGPHPDPAYTVDPSEMNWSRPGGYPRDNWVYVYRQGIWQDLTAGFVQDLVPGFASTTTVLSYQFSYLNVLSGSDIVNSQRGYFVPQATRWDVTDVDALASQYPSKVFIYWTTSLARSIGTAESDAFNEQMRAYSIAHDKILFDVADILSHDPAGNACYDNNGGGHLAICPHYTTEQTGGHLGSVAAGKIRVAKAFWVLMAQIAGWNP
jgi:hypothetical protein